jgi:hypothetical protein
VTFRRGKFQPFFDVNFGGQDIEVRCRNGNLGNACGSLAVPSTPTTAGLLPTQLPSQTSTGTPSQLPANVVIVPVTNPYATHVSRDAFALTAGGGFDFKFNHRFAWRVVQAEYLYTHYGNGCGFAVCSTGRGQDNFRLKSGLVISWGGAK